MPWVLIVVIALVALIVSNTIEIALMGRRIRVVRQTVDLVRNDMKRLHTNVENLRADVTHDLADVTHDLKEIAKVAVAKVEPPTYRPLWPK